MQIHNIGSKTSYYKQGSGAYYAYHLIGPLLGPYNVVGGGSGWTHLRQPYAAPPHPTGSSHGPLGAHIQSRAYGSPPREDTHEYM